MLPFHMFSNPISGHTHESHKVVFNPGMTSKRRRRSSQVSTTSEASQRINATSSCFIHALLEAQKAAEEGRNPDLSPGLHANEEPSEDPITNSRMLTKVQLTDLALGVRELSKRFGKYSSTAGTLVRR